MAHDHHGHHHHHDTGNIKVAFFLNLLFTIIEIIGGILTNSVAILSDAVHDLGDSLSLGLAWYFQNVSKKGRDEAYSYGYKRFSLLGALINSVVLVLGSIFILSEAIPRIINPEVANAKGMILLAILGVIFNGAAVLRLKKGESLNEKVVTLHLIEDVMGWVAVLVGAIIMFFFNLPIIDPILSILITLYILYNVYGNLRQTLQVVLQGIPSGMETEKIKNHLLTYDEIEDVHDLHLWSLDGTYHILTAHLILHQEKNFKELETLKSKIRHGLHHQNIEHATLEFELAGAECSMKNCTEH